MFSFACIFLLASLNGVWCNRFIRSNLNATIDEARLTGGSALTAAYDYIVTVYVPSATTPTDTTGPYGPGVVVKPHWVITHSGLHSTVTDVTTLRAAAGALDGAAPAATAQIKKVKSMITYTSPGTDIDTIKLYKVCPGFTTVATIRVASSPVLTAGTSFKYVNFVPALTEGTKNVGEDCECDTYGTSATDYTNRIVPKTFCGAESTTNKVDATDKLGTIALIGTDVVGLNAQTGTKGELYLELSQYKSWIDTTAMPEP